MKIENLDVGKLVPYARNARVHSREQVAQLATSISEFGFNQPVLVDEKNEIIAGHGRVLAAHRLGLKKVPAIRLSHLSDEKKRAYILADNRIALNSAWDKGILQSELSDLFGQEVDLTALGFESAELEELGIVGDIDSKDLAGFGLEEKPVERKLTPKDYGGMTSIGRGSAPVTYWRGRGLLNGDVLDLGCGQEQHDFAKYDIVHHPDAAVLLRTWDVVMCNFVLNVQPVEHLITQICVMLWHLARPGGVILIAVRNDVEETGETVRGFQVAFTPDQWYERIASVLGPCEQVRQSSFSGFIITKPALN